MSASTEFSALADDETKDKPQKTQSTANVRVMRAGNEDIVVGENASLDGRFDTKGSMYVDGSVWNADLRAAVLSISTTGHVEGVAHVERAEISGVFEGKLNCSGEVILRASSYLSGEIDCGKLVMHRGAAVNARVVVRRDHSSSDNEELSISLPHASKRTLSHLRGAFRRAAPVFKGVFLTLGTIGIVMLVSTIPV
jgi:cytoskeletal protein CcmA (bactofilin family)